MVDGDVGFGGGGSQGMNGDMEWQLGGREAATEVALE